MSTSLAEEKNQYYTYDDYYSWDDGLRWELIDGKAYAMSPAPGRMHQKICGNLHLQLATFLKGKLCEVYMAPFDVRLNADTTNDTVVQPDLVVICDKEKLDERGGKDAPDMAIEVLSKSSQKHDRITKLKLYQSAGVREYWIVDPEDHAIAVHILENGKYIITPYGDEDIVPVQVLKGCEIDLAEVFAL